MPLLLTGASGFVGSHLQAIAECVPLHDEQGALIDIRDHPRVLAAVARVRPSEVIHLAALSDVPQSLRRPRETYEVNCFGTLNLLEALHETGFHGRLLYVGSATVYGRVSDEDLPIREEQPLRPANPYAASKVAAEAMCYEWSQRGEFEVVLARPFNHIGAGQGRQWAIADFAAQIVEMRLGRRAPILHTGNLRVTRDFTDVRDVVRAYLLLLKEGVNGETYNLCSGIERGLRAVVEELGRSAGVEFRIQERPERVRANDPPRLVGSPARLQSRTGWRPEIPWHQTLQDLIASWERTFHG